MKSFSKIALLFFVIPFAVLCYLAYKGMPVEQFHSKVQNSLFTGFLTLGGFLLSLKTFILVQLKKELYDSADYRSHFQGVQEVQKTASLYTPLKNLGEYLLQSVLFSLATSAAQLSIGFIPSKYAACFCLALPIAAFFVVFRAWFAIRKTLHEWFNQLK